MPKNTSMTIRMNSEVKKEAQEIFASLGMDMTTAINIFLRQAIQHHGLPFEVIIREPNKTTIAAIENAQNEIELHGPFDDVDALMKDLNA